MLYLKINLRINKCLFSSDTSPFKGNATFLGEVETRRARQQRVKAGIVNASKTIGTSRAKNGRRRIRQMSDSSSEELPAANNSDARFDIM